MTNEAALKKAREIWNQHKTGSMDGILDAYAQAFEEYEQKLEIAREALENGARENDGGFEFIDGVQWLIEWQKERTTEITEELIFNKAYEPEAMEISPQRAWHYIGFLGGKLKTKKDQIQSLEERNAILVDALKDIAATPDAKETVQPDSTFAFRERARDALKVAGVE